MKSFKEIYEALAAGKITQHQAAAEMKKLKPPHDNKTTERDFLVAGFEWQDLPVVADNAKNPHHIDKWYVWLAGFESGVCNQLQTLVTDAECSDLSVTPNVSVADNYANFAVICFEKIKQLLNAKSIAKKLVQVVIPASEDQQIYSAIMGMLKTATLENPQVNVQLIHIDRSTGTRQLAAILSDNYKTLNDIEIRYHSGIRQVKVEREVETIIPVDADNQPPYKEKGVYLITGGLGGIGLAFAQEILEKSPAANLVLVGLSGLTPAKKSLLDSLVYSSQVEYQSLDVTNFAQVQNCIEGIINKHGQLNGIFHCAGISADNFIIRKTTAEFARVMGPKVAGTVNLDSATATLELDFFVMFSSAASWLGNTGQADYAAANGFMDVFAGLRNQLVSRRERKGWSLSINWPLWKEGKMSIDPAQLQQANHAWGVTVLDTPQAMAAFYQCLYLSRERLLVLAGDVKKIRTTMIGKNKQHAPQNKGFSIVDSSAKQQAIATPAMESVVADSLASMVEKTRTYVSGVLSKLLKLPLHNIDVSAAMENYGIDSIMAMNLTNELEKTFGSLPKTLFFEYQTIRELSDYFIQAHNEKLKQLLIIPAQLISVAKVKEASASNHNGEAAVSASVARKPLLKRGRPNALGHHEDAEHKSVVRREDVVANESVIAIVGLSGRYPLSDNIDAFWQQLAEGIDCITEVPAERWDWRSHYTEDRTEAGHYSKWGGFIAGADEFDPRFFNIAPRDAAAIDPQERLFLQHAWMAIEDAGYTRAGLQIPRQQGLGGQVGVYVGVMYGEYSLSGTLASIANRVSYVLNLHGPSMTLDTMCSSSLTAIHLACQDLKLGYTDLAIAGGVNLSIHPNKYLMLSAEQFISGDGHCQSFGEGGDGYIPGEGVGAVVLKRLADAERDGSPIYGIIRGSALNHGGKTNGYTVPNPQAQAAVIIDALLQAGVNPRHVSYIEAHGTGTKLGDPIEIAALTKAYHQHNQDTGFCLIGSAKSNIGHCESAAGIAGLTKVLLQMKHKKIVPSLHSTRLNPHIDFDKTPFIVNQTLKSWDAPVIDGKTINRIAGISSFGAGGSNAHLVVEEYEAPPATINYHNSSDNSLAILLSARTAEQLTQKAKELLVFITRAEHQLDMDSLAYTLQVGREAMDERVALIVVSQSDLSEKLRSFIAGETSGNDIFYGQAKQNKDALLLFATDNDLQNTLDKWFSERKFSRLLDLWAKGISLDWRKLYPATTPKLISLPTYPFAREKYWQDPVVNSGSQHVVASPLLHPLLQRNVSQLDGIQYQSSFSISESFCKDFQSSNPIRFSAALLLEMARAAVMSAIPTNEQAGQLELGNLVWDQSLDLSGSVLVNTAIFNEPDGRYGVEIYLAGTSANSSATNDFILCQGSARLTATAVAAPLNINAMIAAMRADTGIDKNYYDYFKTFGFNYGAYYVSVTGIYSGNQQLLASLQVPPAAPLSSQLVLHPAIIEGALQAASLLIKNEKETAALPISIDSLVVQDSCVREMFAWVRFTNAVKASSDKTVVDIDLCDQQGNICVALRGLCFQHLDVVDEAIKPVHHNKPAQVAKAEVKISLPVVQAVTAFPALKTNAPISRAISLPDLGSLDWNQPTVTADVRIALSSLTSLTESIDSVSASETSLVEINDSQAGVVTIRLTGGSGLADHLQPLFARQFLAALNAAKEIDHIRVLVLAGRGDHFLSGSRDFCDLLIKQHVFAELINFPYPVIAAMAGDATGPGFLMGAVADFMLLGAESNYKFADAALSLTAAEDNFFVARLGVAKADKFLYSNTDYTGQDLQNSGWNCTIVPRANLEQTALKLAATIANKSRRALQLLKSHLTQKNRQYVTAFSALEKLSGNSASSEMTPALGTKSYDYFNVQETAEKSLHINIGNIQSVGDLEQCLSALSDLLEGIGSHANQSIILTSDHTEFLPAVSKDSANVNLRRVLNRLASASAPIVTVLDKNASGIAFTLANACDCVIYSGEASLALNELSWNAELLSVADIVLAGQFGNYFGHELLLGNQASSVQSLRQIAPWISVSTKERARDQAFSLAAYWQQLPATSLTTWKQRKSNACRNTFARLTQFELALSQEPSPPVSGKIALQSSVVSAKAYSEGVIVISMEDKDAKNMFSDALVAGIQEIAKHIDESDHYKAVVLTGYGNYFASGGTKEGLLAIQEGRGKFTDVDIFQFGLSCKLPVISAMQGHGIGAGWSMGMFADIALFSEESRYLSPYIGYGFTPGAGSTFIFPERIGFDIAVESLLTAQEYSGSELKERSLPARVIPRSEIEAFALSLAKNIATMPRNNLLALKQRWVSHLHEDLAQTYQHELFMHEQTFVGRNDTLQTINSNFAGGTQVSTSIAADNSVHTTVAITAPQASYPAGNSSSVPSKEKLFTNLRKMLADELHLAEAEIDGASQFVDLGLDSITGVTWIRKINEKYNTDLEATKVYSYPTLDKLNAYVHGEILQHAPAQDLVAVELVASSPMSTSIIQSAIPQQTTVSLPTIIKTLKKLLAQELHLGESELEEDTQFIDLGLDSITGVTWIRKINAEYDLALEATKVYSYPTLEKLGRYVATEIVQLAPVNAFAPLLEQTLVLQADKTAFATAMPVIAPDTNNRVMHYKFFSPQPLVSRRASVASKKIQSVTRPNDYQPIAVIGMAGQFPQARNIGEFWDNIAQGRNCIAEITHQRWDLDKYFSPGEVTPGKTYSKWLGALEEYDMFDASFFSISPREATNMDPQQRIFLQTCWNTIEHAGYDAQDLSGSRCGVFVGVAASDYNLITREQQISAQGFTGVATSILAARISYFLNLQGPCISIDTACSSSLVAIANACDSLITGGSDIALAGGVFVMCGPDMHVKTSQSAMLSADGKCHTFDHRANGFVPGEGVGVVMLKRLADAERDRDIILGVVQGWGINQDGKTNGITAPNAESQKILLQDVYDRFQIDPSAIQLVEAHGTGTKLGDPIEIEGLREAFKKYTKKSAYCALGSVKSNIGHCLTAAGVSGFIKVILSLNNKKLPPSINFEKLNEHINLDASPFYVNTQLKDWVVNDAEKRQAVVSSFGFSGTNAHLVISEYVDLRKAAIKSPEVIVPLSARTKEQLDQRARDLRELLHDQNTIAIEDVAYTLQVGREPMEERLGFFISSKQELLAQLDSYLTGKFDNTEIFRAKTSEHKSGINLISKDDDMAILMDNWLANKKYKKLIELWVKGLDVDWRKLYASETPRRINLPTYPFAKERYWMRPATGNEAKHSVHHIHPLLQTNTSDFALQKYTTLFTTEDRRYLKEGSQGDIVISWPFLVEMICVAVNRSIPGDKAAKSLALNNLVFAAPISVSAPTSVDIALFDNGNQQVQYEIYSCDPVSSEDVVYCQGYAAYVPALPIGSLDIAKFINASTPLAFVSATNEHIDIYLDKEQLLVRVEDVASVRADSENFIQPKLLDLMGDIASSIFNLAAMSWATPSGITSVQMNQVTDVCYARIYLLANQTDNLVLDLCDEHGEICTRLQGCAFGIGQTDISSVAATVVEETVAELFEDAGVTSLAETLNPTVDIYPRTLELDYLEPLRFVTEDNNLVVQEIKLSTPEEIDAHAMEVNSASIALPKIQLSKMTEEFHTTHSLNPDNSYVTLTEKSTGVYSLEITLPDVGHADWSHIAGQVVIALGVAAEQDNIKVLVFRGSQTAFTGNDPAAYNAAVTSRLFAGIAEFPYPTIALLPADALDVGFVLAANCDFMICNSEARYGFTHAAMALLNNELLQFLGERFGNHFALGLLRGAEMGAPSWLNLFAAPGVLQQTLDDLVGALINKPRDGLGLLKQAMSQHLINSVNALQPVQPLPLPVATPQAVLQLQYQHIRLEEGTNGVLLVQADGSRKRKNLQAVIKDLCDLLVSLRALDATPAMVVSLDCFDWNLTTDKGIDSGLIAQLVHSLLESELVVVATLRESMSGLGWLVSQCCAAVVYADNGRYSLVPLSVSKKLMCLASILFENSFGYSGRDLVFSAKNYKAAELATIGAGIACSSDADLISTATSIAARIGHRNIASANQKLKVQIASLLSTEDDLASAVVATQRSEIKTPETKSAQAIPLASSVIHARAYPDGVVLVTMEDRDAKNMFSDDFLAGMYEVFAHIDNHAEYKVIVLTGYESYFSSGGTKEGLLAIQQGKYKFTDRKVFQLPLECKLPVIAAMQGHGIGAGWSMGAFADFTMMSEKSRYLSPYMNYGFTPGAGSTFIFPKRIGYDLAKESLFTGHEYSGKSLAQRGMAIRVLPSAQVVEEALLLAHKLASINVTTLRQLKTIWNEGIVDYLEETYQRELAMHEQTFVGRSDTLAQIQGNFARDKEVQPVASVSIPAISQPVERPLMVEKHPVVTAENAPSLPQIIGLLKSQLALELQMSEKDIGNDRQFVDLGVDSIIGVSWVNAINKKYKTQLEATKVYSHPTLNELGQLVHEQLVATRDKNIASAIEAPIPIPSFAVPVAARHIDAEAASAFKVENYSVDVQAILLSDLRKSLAEELEMNENDIGRDIAFVALGVDSIIGVSWVNKINKKYKTVIEATRVYSHPNLAEFAAYVKGEAELQGTLPLSGPVHAPVTGSAIGQPPVIPLPQREINVPVRDPVAQKNALRSWRSTTKPHSGYQRAAERSTSIAIIGMAGQFPMANDLDQFWNNLWEGRNCIAEVPASRWNVNQYYSADDQAPGKINCKWMGSLEEYDLFDPLFFNISPLEAETMDPQQRLFLQTCWQTIEDAAYDARALSGSKCGVFVGCGTGDYHTFAQGMGGSVSILAARISYFLNLQGPCLSIDTACSSSLVAMASACDSLVLGASDVALAGGVCVMSGPAMHLGTAQAGMLSKDGRCFTFDKRANGFVPGEGVGVVMLKRLADAERDQDIILGVIEGWGVNQDGKTNGITAPNPKSQTRLQHDVYERFAIDPSSIQLIEAHGTGTRLGDPIEIEGLKDSFKKYTQKTNFCALGSVKSNIGHCLFAAGVSGVIKLLLALKHRKMPPTINFDSINEHINLNDSPFYVNHRRQEWDVADGEARRAAISSYGFSGTNAHLVLAEYVTPQNAPSFNPSSVNNGNPAPSDAVIVLSAKSAEQLQQRISDLYDYLNKTTNSLDVHDIAYTLQVGREPMSYRLSFIVSSLMELHDKLALAMTGNHIALDFHSGNSIEDNFDNNHDQYARSIDAIVSAGQLEKLAALWAKGVNIDWKKLYQSSQPTRIKLPIYPFAKERYWLHPTEMKVVTADNLAYTSEQLHSLEDVINRIDNETLEKEQGVRLLKSIL